MPRQMLAGVLLFSICAAIYAWRKGQYLFALAVGLIALYELTAPTLWFFGGLLDLSAMDALFGPFADEADVERLLAAVAVLLGALTCGYAVPLAWHHNQRPRDGEGSDYVVLIGAIFAMGAASVYAGAGATRLQDYLGGEERGLPVFNYGLALMVVVLPLLIACWNKRLWWLCSVLLVAIAPLCYEAFAGGRRQFFAPLVFLAIIYALYNPSVKRRLLWFTAAAVFIVVFFGWQYHLRVELGGTGGEETVAAQAIFPQLGEFIAIGSTSLYAVALIDGQNMTYGQHIGINLLNTVPYLKLGDIFFSVEGEQYRTLLQQLAPVGGLSALADAWLAFRWLGVALVGLTFGVLLRAAEHALRRVFSSGLPFHPRDVFVICLIATEFVKYRSGVSDMLQAAINFSLLYWAFILAGVVFTDAARLQHALKNR